MPWRAPPTNSRRCSIGRRSPASEISESEWWFRPSSAGHRARQQKFSRQFATSASRASPTSTQRSAQGACGRSNRSASSASSRRGGSTGIHLWNEWTRMWNGEPALAHAIVADRFALHLTPPTGVDPQTVKYSSCRRAMGHRSPRQIPASQVRHPLRAVRQRHGLRRRRPVVRRNVDGRFVAGRLRHGYHRVPRREDRRVLDDWETRRDHRSLGAPASALTSRSSFHFEPQFAEKARCTSSAGSLASCDARYPVDSARTTMRRSATSKSTLQSLSARRIPEPVGRMRR
jgi:hypothetical protein